MKPSASTPSGDSSKPLDTQDALQLAGDRALERLRLEVQQGKFALPESRRSGLSAISNPMSQSSQTRPTGAEQSRPGTSAMQDIIRSSVNEGSRLTNAEVDLLDSMGF
jgi:hypothetical protein